MCALTIELLAFYLPSSSGLSPRWRVFARPVPWQAWYLLRQKFGEHIAELGGGDGLPHPAPPAVVPHVVDVPHVVHVTVVPVVGHVDLVLGEVGILRPGAAALPRPDTSA